MKTYLKVFCESRKTSTVYEYELNAYFLLNVRGHFGTVVQKKSVFLWTTLNGNIYVFL